LTVTELQTFLSDLGKLLRSSGSASVATEMEYIAAKLAPFREYKLKAFADFLEKAEAFCRGELAPMSKGGGPKKGKADPAAIEQVCQRTLELYNKAIDASVTVEQIETAVKTLEQLDPTKPKLDELARSIGYTQKFKAKADIIKAIRQKILGRKGAFERPNA
jgi:hypothetical protein